MSVTVTPQSGTTDKNYDLLFRRMQEHSRRGAEECKQFLRQRLGEGS
jgi:hypothetical protein